MVDLLPMATLPADPSLGMLFVLALLWLSAKVGGEFATRLKMPAVVGELSAGMVLMAIYSRWPSCVPNVATSPAADMLATLGIVILMFSVGLESTVPQMMKVGFPSLRVAALGVILPMMLGLGVVMLLVGNEISLVTGLFAGACLCATSVGISARVLQQKHAGDTPEGRVILGAAVLDDVLGLLVLVMVAGMAKAAVVGQAVPWGEVTRTLLMAVLFLGGALTAGRWLTPHLFRMANRFRVEELLLPLSLAFGFLMAWGGGHAGLAPIVGAYAAGLILEHTHIEILQEREHRSLDSLIHPLVTVLAPIFFVVMGARIDLHALLQPHTFALALVLTLAGVVGKYVAGFGAGPGFNSSIVGWGMMPRGEVGLIFAATGAQLKILDPGIQSAVVMAMMLTTVIGPIGLGWLLQRHSKPSRP